jgi:hypothetical protein
VEQKNCGQYKRVEERIYWLVKGKPKEHPAVFPIELPTRIIASLPEEEERVRVSRELSLHKVKLTFRERKERGLSPL